jgi:hypothetical protein
VNQSIALTPELARLMETAKWFAEQQWRGLNDTIVTRSVNELHNAAEAFARTQDGAQ